MGRDLGERVEADGADYTTDVGRRDEESETVRGTAGLRRLVPNSPIPEGAASPAKRSRGGVFLLAIQSA
jgi:hypothetical protein